MQDPEDREAIMKGTDPVAIKFNQLREEHDASCDFYDKWTASYWRSCIFWVFLHRGWRRKHDAWETKYELFVKEEFEPAMAQTRRSLEYYAAEGNTPFIALLAKLDQLDARKADLRDQL